MFQRIFSILKKNKMFFLLILVFLVCPMNAKAKEYYYAEVSFQTFQGKHYYIGGVSNTTGIYKIYLNGSPGVCIDPGADSGSGKIYIRGEKVPHLYSTEMPSPYHSAEIYAAHAIQSLKTTQSQNEMYGLKFLPVGFIQNQAYLWQLLNGSQARDTKSVCELINRVKVDEGGTTMDCNSAEEISALDYSFIQLAHGGTGVSQLYYWYALGESPEAKDGTGSAKCQRFIAEENVGTLINAANDEDLVKKLKEKYPNLSDEEFEDQKMCGPMTTDKTNKNKCPDPEVTVAGQCGSRTSYNDPYLGESWKCIKGVDKYLDKTVGNEYCRVYCREDVYTSFPGDAGYVFQAGRYFTVGTSTLAPTWGPITITGKRECRTYTSNSTSAEEGINYQKWLQDYIAANEKIKNEYNAWQLAYAKSVGSITPNVPCELRREQIKVTCDASHKRGDVCYDEKIIWGEKYVLNYTYNGVTLPEDASSCNGALRTYTHDGGAAYRRAIEARNALEDKMRKCETLNPGYDFNPTVEFNYSGDPQYSLSGQLESTASQSDTVNVDKIKEEVSYVNNIKVVDCGSSTSQRSCSAVYNNIHFTRVNVGQKRKTINTTVNYYLTKDLWQYIDKVTGDMKKTTNGLDQYIDLGAKVLPVSAYRSPGTYPLNLTYYKVGNIVSDEAHFDKYAKYSTGTVTNQYACTYQVTNELYGRECGEPGKPKYCDPCTGTSCLNPGKHPVGIDVIYRPISLSNPFPSENGKGRSTGANWCSSGNCANNNDLVKSVITNNRGVKEDAVYNKNPIYSITLTPAIIRNIRDYNKTQRKSDGYGDFNLVCDQGTGLNCLSNFIRTSEFSSLFSGSCAKAGRSEFESCRK